MEVERKPQFIQRFKQQYREIPYPILSFLALCFCLIFSYQPSISFGTLSGINLKLSLTILTSLLFALISIPILLKNREVILRSIGAKIFFIFCLINSLSIFWSINKPRGLFEAGLLWLLFLVFISILANFQKNIYKKNLIWVIWAATAAVCLFSIWQIIGDAIGISNSFTLLPVAYQSVLFGVARPTAFALEPEFLGSFLVLPILTSAYLLLKSDKRTMTPIILFFSSTILIMAISRGALISVIIGIILLLVFVRSSYKNILKIFGILIASALIAVISIGVAAHINNRDAITGRSAIVGFVSQMTLGVVNIDLGVQPEAPQAATPIVTTPVTQEVTPVYVAQSTDSRLLMSKEALSTWTRDPKTFLLGSGLGSFGATIHKRDPSHAINSIANNEYLQVASELGVIGLVTFIALLLGALWVAIKTKQILIIAILVSFYIQWLFFSGNINVIQLWIVLALAYCGIVSIPKKSSEYAV